MKITYIKHSAFCVELEDVLLVFDYQGDGSDLPEQSGKQVVVLISHRHSDHFAPAVIDWARAKAADCVLGYDLPEGLPGVYLRPGQSWQEDKVGVRAFGSTDEGVSFLVQAGGYTIFHAGDLNFWHWRNEADDAFVEEARTSFEKVLDSMPDEPIDVAFFPVDGRMGADCGEGAQMFVRRFRPRLLVPMHFWDDPSCAVEFAKGRMPDGVRAAVLATPGETMDFA